MSNEIATITPAGTAVSLPAEITEQTKADARNAWAAATQRIYKNGWRVWTNWAALYGVVALPADPERVADFLSNLGRSRKMSTLRGYLSAISAAHRSAKVQFDPEAEAIKRVMKGLGRNKVGDLRKAAPLLPQHVQAALKADAKPTLLDYRDCALLGLGLAMAARRSELVGLDLGTRGDGDDCVGVLELRDDGAVVRLHKSKTVTAEPHEIFIQPGVALKAVRLWIERGAITAGTPLFRGVSKKGRVAPTRLCDRTVSRVVKKHCEAAGLDTRLYSGHSLRSGAITAGFEAGLAAWIIKLTSRHKSTEVLEAYNQPVERKRYAMTEKIGL